MTDEELTALEELEKKATGGTWEWFASDGPTPQSFIADVLRKTEESGKFISNVHGCQVEIDGESLTTVITGCGPTSPDNAMFLTCLRNAAKSLIASAKREKELENVIRWALGEIGEFPPRKDGDGSYWWRTELRRRAALQPKPSGGEK